MNSRQDTDHTFQAPSLPPGRALLAAVSVVLVIVALSIVVTKYGDGNPPAAPAPTSSSPSSLPTPASLPPSTASPPVSPTTSRVWTPAAVTEWGKRVNGAMEELTASLGRMTNAMQAGDFGAMQDACASIGHSGEKLSAALPGYNQQVTASVQTMVDDIAAAHRTCAGFKPTMSEAQFNQFIADLNRAVSQGSVVAQQGG